MDELAKLVHHHLVPLDNGYVALAMSFACFPLVIPLGYLGFTYIESPFLAYRVPYLRPRVESRLTAASPLGAALETHRPG